MKLLITFCLSVLMLSVANAQAIPNASFDNWAVTQMGYNDPVDWFTTNFMTSSTVLSAELITASHSGAAAISLKNPSDGFGAFALTFFASHERPVALKGFTRYLPNLGDSASVMVALTKWNASANQSEAVGGAELKFGGTSGINWDEFELPIQYMTTETPDSITIMVMASGMNFPREGSVFMVDDLEFVTQVNAAPEALKPINLTLFPNPSAGNFAVQLTEDLGYVYKFQIVDLMGRVVQAGNVTPDMQSTGQLRLDAGTLNPGMYQVLLSGERKSAVARLVIAR